ncbi:hypothetical protein GMMP15_600001 [Candidatus Magnetomoraceae bacterium gMMP-15]
MRLFNENKKSDHWYGSDIMCIIIAGLMGLAFLFGLIGIWATQTTPEYKVFKWVPVILSITSAIVMAMSLGRFIKKKWLRPKSLRRF